MPDITSKSRYTFEGLKSDDFKVDPQGKVTIDNEALAKALRDKVQDTNLASAEGDYVRVSVDVG